ncbi:MAG: TetR/AcrR family transcriptional regulator [Lysinibacillus sp.]
MKHKQRKAQMTRQKLVEAARSIFSENGFQHCTMKDIITEANVGYGTAYVYFPNKDTLFCEVIDTYIQKMLEVAGSPFTPASVDEAVEKIEKQTEAFLQVAYESRKVFIIIEEAIRLSPIVDAKWKTVRDHFIKGIRKDIEYVQQAGLAKQLDVSLIAESWFYLNEHMLFSLIKQEHADVAHTAKTIVTLYTRGLYQ